MDLSRLPRLPLHFFYHPFSRTVKGIFLGLMTILLLVSGFLLFAHSNPDFWSLDVAEVQESFKEPVPVTTIEAQYREVELNLNSFRQWTTYSVGAIQPSAFPFVLFLIVQVIAWSVFLAATTEIQSRWVYLFYLFFALFIHFSEISTILYPGEVYKVLEGLILLCYLGLGYAFQTEMLKWKFLWRFLAILGLGVIFFGYGFAKGGWLMAHAVNLNTFSYLAFVSILFLFFLGKDPLNLLIWLGTNHPNPKRRLSTWPLLAVCIVWLLLVLVWIDEYMNFDLLGGFHLPLRPFHLVALFAVLTVFLSQNLYYQVRKALSTNTSFTFLILSWAAIALSALFVNSTVGDPLYGFTMERLASIFFIGIGFAQIIYVFSNHKPLLDRRVHLYYLLARGTKFSFTVVWIIGLIAIVIAEGQGSWKSFNLLFQSEACHEADHAWLNQDREGTIASYERAIIASKPSPKANYNMASLVLSDPDKIGEAVQLYQKAAQLYQFPYALMNASELLRLNRQPEDAERVLRKGLDSREPHPHLLNNLAITYLNQGLSDSAITYFKASLLADIQASSVYTNLAQVYWDNDRLEEARTFFEAALNTRSPSEAAYTNAIAFSLKHPQDQMGPTSEVPPTEDYFLSYNHQLLALRDAPELLDPIKVKQLTEQDNSTDAVILDAYLMFLADSTIHAASRIQGLSNSYPGLAGRANFVLGAAYLEKGVPEMARKYFQIAGEAGNPYGTLYAAKMNIDLGFADSANFQLSALRAEHEELWEPCAKEIAMLLHAYGQGLYAQTEWDINALSLNERMRISLYADSLQQFAIALENFRQIQDVDSTTLLPYLEMGRLYNKYKDPFAVSDISYGLQKDSSFLPLQIEYARALLYQEEWDKAASQIENLPLDGPNAKEIRFLNAEYALARQDTATAIAMLDTLYQLAPMYQPGLLLLADLLWAKQELELGNALITKAIEDNSENPELWVDYALFSRQWSLPEDAGYGAIRAIELSPSASRREAIAAEFAEEIRLIVNTE